MEIILSKKLQELTGPELTEALRKFMMQDREAFKLFKEIVEDIL
jgi:hypothetical protein